MRKTTTKKLALRTETLRRLQPVTESDLQHVAGGGPEGARRSTMCNSMTTEPK